MGDEIQMSLEQAAQTSELGAQLGHAWQLITCGIEYHMLDAEQLPELIAHLKEGRDFCIDELAFEFIDGKLAVRLLEESEPTDTATMVRALECLRTHGSGVAQ